MASFLLVGCLPTPNTAPVITTETLPNAVVETPYTTTVLATDVDTEDVLTFSLVTYPTGMVISEEGVISGWTPVATGTQPVTVAVTDGTDSVSADFTITIDEAQVVNTAPVITAIADQTTILGETFTYPVVATDAEADALTYSLTDCPLLMEISAVGVITWTPEFATQLGPHAVVVEVSDGALVDTEDFVLTVVEPEPLVIDIDVPDAYVHPTKGPIVAADCYDVVVTFSDNSTTEGQDVWARWSDVTPDPDVNGPWVLLDANADYTEFTGEICFDTAAITECEPICIEVKVGTICCDPIIYSEMITVDTIAPCASFTVTFEDCDECVIPRSAEMSWTTTCEDICDDPFDCCGDDCSGVGDWSFVLDDDLCLGPCDTETGDDCAITGGFECGCLLYADSGEVVVYIIDVSIFDNVDNEFTDTWTLTFDTDSLVGLVSGGAADTEITAGEEWYVDYGCEWEDCAECLPLVD
jgi:hypothetical protein